jgi:hypothetical protein
VEQFMNSPKSISDILRFKFGGVRGAGDLIANITSSVGIRPCESCKDRQKKLNQIISFSSGVTTSKG